MQFDYQAKERTVIMINEKKLQMLIDRDEIQDQLYLYSQLVDNKRYDEFNKVFTDDAVIDFTSPGSICGSYTDLANALEVSNAYCTHMHLFTNIIFDISEDGQTAKTRHYLYNPQAYSMGEGKTSIALFGSYYDSEWVKLDGTWKIKKFVQTKKYLTSMLDEMKF